MGNAVRYSTRRRIAARLLTPGRETFLADLTREVGMASFSEEIGKPAQMTLPFVAPGTPALALVQEGQILDYVIEGRYDLASTTREENEPPDLGQVVTRREVWRVVETDLDYSGERAPRIVCEPAVWSLLEGTPIAQRIGRQGDARRERYYPTVTLRGLGFLAALQRLFQSEYGMPEIVRLGYVEPALAEQAISVRGVGWNALQWLRAMSGPVDEGGAACEWEAEWRDVEQDEDVTAVREYGGSWQIHFFRQAGRESVGGAVVSGVPDSLSGKIGRQALRRRGDARDYYSEVIPISSEATSIQSLRWRGIITRSERAGSTLALERGAVPYAGFGARQEARPSEEVALYPGSPETITVPARDAVEGLWIGNLEVIASRVDVEQPDGTIMDEVDIAGAFQAQGPYAWTRREADAGGGFRFVPIHAMPDLLAEQVQGRQTKTLEYGSVTPYSNLLEEKTRNSNLGAVEVYEGTPAPPLFDEEGVRADFAWASEGRTVTFTDRSAGAVGVAWDFGDGSAPAYAEDENPVHVFGAAGTYTVTLTATGPDGGGSAVRLPIEVAPGVDAGGDTDPSAEVAVRTRKALGVLFVTASARAEPERTGESFRIFEEIVTGPGAGPAAPVEVFDSEGEYRAQLVHSSQGARQVRYDVRSADDTIISQQAVITVPAASTGSDNPFQPPFF